MPATSNLRSIKWPRMIASCLPQRKRDVLSPLPEAYSTLWLQGHVSVPSHLHWPPTVGVNFDYHLSGRQACCCLTRASMVHMHQSGASPEGRSLTCMRDWADEASSTHNGCTSRRHCNSSARTSDVRHFSSVCNHSMIYAVCGRQSCGGDSSALAGHDFHD